MENKFMIDSQICAVVPKRSGTEIVFRYDVRDEEGRLYHTEYNGCRLTGMVFAGDEIEIRIISATDKEVFFEVMNLTSGRAALSDGYVRLR